MILPAVNNTLAAQVKIALDRVSKLLPNFSRSRVLALYSSFIKLSYHIDNKVLYEIVGACRQTFGTALSMARGVL
jgi:hypothetical protein